MRSEIRPSDAAAVQRIVSSSGFFNAEEVEVAVSLVQERLEKGEASGYFFLFAEAGGRVDGYSCYGPIAGTQESYDLYWIAVEQGRRRHGLGKRLLAASEQAIAAAGGRRVYVETSSRELYAPTRAFYEANGYARVALLDDFYAPGDAKVVYLKLVGPGPRVSAGGQALG